jgi:hypothetical protein
MTATPSFFTEATYIDVAQLSLNVSATLLAGPFTKRFSSVLISGVGTITAGAKDTIFPAVFLYAGGQVFTSALRDQALSVLLTGQSSAFFEPKMLVFPSAQMSGSGLLGMSGAVGRPDALLLSATSTLTSTMIRSLVATTLINANAVLSTNALDQVVESIKLTGQSSFFPGYGLGITLPLVSLSPRATMIILPVGTRFSDVNFNASAVLSSNPIDIAKISISLSARGLLSPRGTRVKVVSLDLRGNAKLVVGGLTLSTAFMESTIRWSDHQLASISQELKWNLIGKIVKDFEAEFGIEYRQPLVWFNTVPHTFVDDTGMRVSSFIEIE